MKLLILSSSTGGGHDMRAYSLQDWWQARGGRAMVCHPMESASKIYKLGTETYNTIQRKAPFLHSIYFRFLEYGNLHKDERIILGRKSFEHTLSTFKPDAVISMHPHLNHGYLNLTKREFPKLPFIIYCGEFSDSSGFSRHWVNSNADFFFGPFPETCHAAIRRGMPITKVEPVGFILRKAFYQRYNQRDDHEIFRSLGVEPEIPFILLGTGANNANNHVSILKNLSKDRTAIGFHGQVVALCGDNLQLQKKVQEIIPKEFNLIDLPKVCDQRMYCLLRHALCLIGRPGAGLTAEVMASNTPVIFNVCGGVMPQEKNNLNFWKSHAERTVILKRTSELSTLLTQDIPSLHYEQPEYPEILDKIESIICEAGN